jgi:hypothetical protein
MLMAGKAHGIWSNQPLQTTSSQQAVMVGGVLVMERKHLIRAEDDGLNVSPS